MTLPAYLRRELVVLADLGELEAVALHRYLIEVLQAAKACGRHKQMADQLVDSAKLLVTLTSISGRRWHDYEKAHGYFRRTVRGRSWPVRNGRSNVVSTRLAIAHNQIRRRVLLR
jgi:hypothetical protein